MTKRSTDLYPGMIRMEGSSTIQTPEPREREFVIARPGKKTLTVRAESCQIQPSGALIFQTQGELVMVISSTGYSYMEEAEADD